MNWSERVDDLKKGLAFGIGAVTGGSSQVKVVAAGAALKQKALTSVEKLGAKLGKEGTGAAVFEALGKGAKKTDAAETQSFLKEKAGVDLQKYKNWVLLALAGGALLFLARK